MGSCDQCGDPASTICDVCSKTICDGCSYTCLDCGRTVCPDCAVWDSDDGCYCEDCWDQS